MQWLYLYFPSLQLDQILIHMQEQSNQQPGAVVLYDVTSQQIIQVSAEARGAGIHESMALSDSWVLCEQLRTFPFRPSVQRQLLYQLTRVLYRYIALISLDHPQGLWLETSSMRRLYKSESSLLKQIEKLLQQHGIHYRHALSRSALAAKISARTGEYRAERIAVTELPCSLKLLQKLQRMGLKTIADVLQVPRSTLGHKLGKELIQVLAEYQGQRVRPLSCFQPPALFYQRLVLLSEIHDWGGLRFPLKRLLGELSEFLELRQQQTQRVRITLYHRELQPTQFVVGMAHGCWHTEDFMHLCQLKIEQHTLSAPVIEISLQAKELVSRVIEKRELWEQGKQDSIPLGQLLNQLQLRLGDDQVKGLQVAPSWLPEYSWRRVQGGQEVRPSPLTERPLWLLDAPEAVNDMQLWSLVTGPERIESGWWDGQRVYRDYYKARYFNGACGWLFYDKIHCSWWLHGWFS